jgi:hypothetical protein
VIGIPKFSPRHFLCAGILYRPRMPSAPSAALMCCHSVTKRVITIMLADEC